MSNVPTRTRPATSRPQPWSSGLLALALARAGAPPPLVARSWPRR